MRPTAAVPGLEREWPAVAFAVSKGLNNRVNN